MAVARSPLLGADQLVGQSRSRLVIGFDERIQVATVLNRQFSVARAFQ
jgi:hypothetical protein